MTHLTKADKLNIAYYILEKGDIERWCDYEDKKHLIARELPELMSLIVTQKAIEDKIIKICKGIDEELLWSES